MKLQGEMFIEPFNDYESFSEMAKKLPEGEITKIASTIAQNFKKEFDRRLAEGVGLYRPWDDKQP